MLITPSLLKVSCSLCAF